MSDIIGFDTETLRTNNENKFLCFTAYSDDVIMYSESLDDLSKLFCEKNKGARIYAHNLEFDFGVIREWLENNFFVDIKYAKSRLISVTLRRNELSASERLEGRETQKPLFVMLDSMNFYPMALKKLGAIVNHPKKEAPAYLGMRKYETPEEFQAFRDYAMSDAIIVYKGMMLFNETVNGSLGVTLASTALKYFKSEFFDYLSQFKITHWMNKDVHQSYFGGRVESFQRGMIKKENFGTINVYDFNSLYPSVMKNPMPDLSHWPVIRKDDFRRDKLGCALAHIKSDCKYPIMPVRSDKLRFVNGNLFGWYSIPELCELESSGEGNIISVRKAYEWDAVPSYFSEYVNHFYNARLEAKKQGSTIQEIYKLMMNALYGKWGEIIEPITYKKINSVNDFSHADNIIRDYAVFKEAKKFTKHTFFPIASTITAYARLKLHDKIHDVVDKRRKEIFYCDTDSLFTNAELNHSSELGDLKLETDKCKDWYLFMRAKAYLCDSYVKLKGSKRGLQSLDVIKNLESDDSIRMKQDRFVRFRESLRRVNKHHLESEIRNKVFSTASDGKRIYNKELTSKNLLTDFTDSQPLSVLQ